MQTARCLFVLAAQQLLLGCSAKLDHLDVDGDGYTVRDGDCWDASEGPDGAAISGDQIHPGASESWYDGVDQDCDGLSDFDQDRDGFDDVAFGGTDCDDLIDAVNPEQAETWYDGLDADCDGRSDFDQDRDGSDSAEAGGGDCDDLDAAFGPDVEEIWYDDIDQNCDGWSDYDADQDGFDSWEYATGAEVDCDDADPAINPDATEIWYDDTDQDCDGGGDYDADLDGYDSDLYGGQDCDDADAEISPEASETWYDGVDQDCDGWEDYDQDRDGYISEEYGGDDCDDERSNVSPGASEVCNFRDDNCDGTVDSGRDVVDSMIYYLDDGDGYGDPDEVELACDDYSPDGYVLNPDDCDDSDADTFPGAAESESATRCMNDDDRDGYGDETVGLGVTAGSDCDDSDSGISPGDTEITGDEIDQTCDDKEVCYVNVDGDAYRTSSAVTSVDTDCDDFGEAASSVTSGDCDDSDADTFPGAPERCDLADNDCDDDYQDIDIDSDGDGVPDFTSAGMVFAGLSSDDYLVIADDPALDFGTGDFTIELWVNAATFIGVDGAGSDEGVRLLDRTWGSYPTDSYWALDLNDGLGAGYPELELVGEGEGDLMDATFAADVGFSSGTWTHLAVVVDRAAGQATWYVGGLAVEVAALTSRFAVADVSSYSDLFVSSAYNTFDGGLDEIRIWATARSADEVLVDMCRSTETSDADYDDLILYLPLESDYQDAGPSALTVTIGDGSPALTSW